MVSNCSIAGIIFSLVVSFGLPVGLGIYFGVRYRVKLLSIATGMAVFIVFSLILESIMHYCLLYLNPATAAFLNNPWAYGIYGGLAAGVFEEGGRFLAFMFILKKMTAWKDGVAYGVGHGGMEAVIVGGLGNLNYLIYAVLINSGSFGDLISKAGSASSATAKELGTLKDSLISTSPVMFTLSGIERLAAFALQIALSLLVLYCVKNRRYLYLLYAVLIHAAVDFPAALYQKGVLSIWVVESIIFVVGVASLVFIIKSKKLFAKPADEEQKGLPPVTFWK